MKKMITKILTVITAMVLFAGPIAFAEDSAPPAGQSHEEHHPEGQAANGMGGEGMMGSMDMNSMMGMMNSCMEMHKSGKMCEHQTMEACQKQMDKGGCQGMMKQVKTEKKTKAKAKK